MSNWARIIQYRDFYDLPRIFLLDYDGQFLLFDCRFDQQADEYSLEYEVFSLPQLSEQELRGSWEELTLKANFYLGRIAVPLVEFDRTKHQAINIDTDWFKRLIINK